MSVKTITQLAVAPTLLIHFPTPRPARLPFAAGIDHVLPAAFGRRDPRTSAPIVALVTQGALTIVVLVLGQAGASVRGAYDFLVSMSVLGAVLIYVLIFAVALRLPLAGRRARATRALAVVGGASTIVAIGCTLVPSSNEPHKLAAFLKVLVSTVVMVGAGAAFYAIASRCRARVAAIDR